MTDDTGALPPSLLDKIKALHLDDWRTGVLPPEVLFAHTTAFQCAEQGFLLGRNYSRWYAGDHGTKDLLELSGLHHASLVDSLIPKYVGHVVDLHADFVATHPTGFEFPNCKAITAHEAAVEVAVELSEATRHALRGHAPKEPARLPILTLESLERLKQALAREATLVARAREAPTPQPAHREDPSGASPPVYLTSWREILHDLGLKSGDKDKVRKLNEEHGGPIILPEKGGQPRVEKGKLLTWWVGIEKLWDEQRQRQLDRDSTLEAAHDYGRDATVLPDISGSVKKRRKDHHH